QRVGPEPAHARNPLVGARELEGRIADVESRKPDALVLSEGFTTPYLAEAGDRARPLSGIVQARQSDSETMAFVRTAVVDGLPNYRLTFASRPHLPRWANALGLRPIPIQGTTALSLWVLTREKDATSAR